jgi:hypothetical protein
MHDLFAMLNLLSQGRKANNGTHYVHRGDLQWWLFYADDPKFGSPTFACGLLRIA